MEKLLEYIFSKDSSLKLLLDFKAEKEQLKKIIDELSSEDINAFYQFFESYEEYYHMIRRSITCFEEDIKKNDKSLKVAEVLKEEIDNMKELLNGENIKFQLLGIACDLVEEKLISKRVYK